MVSEEAEIEEILNSNDPYKILDYTLVKRKIGKDALGKLEDAIIKIGNATCIYYFARDVKRANIAKLENAIIATGDAQYIYRFAKDVRKANISKLEDAIIATGDAQYIYRFAEDVRKANISKLEDAIIATGDTEYICYFAWFVKKANISKLEIEKVEIQEILNSNVPYKILDYTLVKRKISKDALGKLEDAIIKIGNATCIYYFARDVKRANIAKLENAIIAIGDAQYIYLFADGVRKANISKLEDAIVTAGNAKYIYKFANDVKKANISKLEDAIIATGNAEYIYKFARNVGDTNIPKLEDAIITTGNVEYIYHFALNIDGANIEKLEDAIAKIEKANIQSLERTTQNYENIQDPSDKNLDERTLLSQKEIEWLTNISLTDEKVFLHAVASIAKDNGKKDLYLKLLRELSTSSYYLHRDSFLKEESSQNSNDKKTKCIKYNNGYTYGKKQI